LAGCTTGGIIAAPEMGELALPIVAGIDEAGFGPVLGPLVVSTAAFEMPQELMDVSLWRLLGGAVCRRPARKSGRIAIDDSKKLYSRQKANALEHLERAVLAVLASRGLVPRDLDALLGAIAPRCRERMERYPWYSPAELAIPRCVSTTSVKLAGNSLRVTMDRVGVRLAAVRAEPIFVGEFNRHVAATNNKSSMLFDVTSRLLAGLWKAGPPGKLRICVDRHGGRRRYLPALQRVFQGCRFKVIEEADHLSAYRVSGTDREAEIYFLTGGDERHLAVALASMISKYLRELFMELLNCFWAGHISDLAPTAGYYNDGRRFFQQIAPAIRRLGVSEHLLYRSR